MLDRSVHLWSIYRQSTIRFKQSIGYRKLNLSSPVTYGCQYLCKYYAVTK
jgi:hypothetical protein